MSGLTSAKIIPRRSNERGHTDIGWLDSKLTFSAGDYYDPQHESWGSIRVLNEDRVAPQSGFPTHPHRNFEIFSYVLSGELTHRDSMQKRGAESNDKDLFYRVRRGDVQMTTGGRGIAHSEQNEHDEDTVHFLQIWIKPWKLGLTPIYHTHSFPEAEKRKRFLNIITPLKAGRNATAEEERQAVPVKEGTIPIHADVVFSAGVISPGQKFEYKVGGDDYVSSKTDRKLYIHLAESLGGETQVKLAERNESILSKGDGAYISSVHVGNLLTVENVGQTDAEVVVLDSN